MARNTIAPWAEPVPDAPYPLTADDLLRRYSDTPGYELVEGRLVRVTPTGRQHGRVTLKLSRIVGDFVEKHHLGEASAAETGFRLGEPGAPETVLAPDLAVVRAERIPIADEGSDEGFWPIAPDVVAEVASPSQYRPEMIEKANLWLENGVRLIWVVWPEAEEVMVFRPGQDMAILTHADALDGFDVLPSFSCPVAALFDE